MARKLRFFRDQMSKAGVPTAERSQAALSLDDLEVRLVFSNALFHCY